MTRAGAWIFDELPPSGARRGGDPASHVFEASLRTFVREVVQNASDQAADGAPQVHFRFHELGGAALEAFLDALGWSTLRPHLEAASRTRGGRGIQAALEELDRRGRLRLLVIEDRETVGLTGAELEGESHFRALCKDTLYSHKRTDEAGGSYGLGKSVLWGFSGLATVLFNSRLSAELPGQTSPRLIGRAELPTHAVGARPPRWFAGSGWFGHKVTSPGIHAESLWAEAAEQLAAKLLLARTDAESTGTSILVVGFRDPTSETERSLEELAREVQRAIERELWPALAMPGLPLVAWVAAEAAGKRITERDLQLVRPFVDCYQRRGSTLQTLGAAGDVVVRELELDVPARKDGAEQAVRGRVRLCVRLFDEGERHELAGQVAMFRGPGMVVRYLDRRALAAAARPFHAVVACGEARAPEAPLPSDRAVERFLRAAEPPGHDRWETTATLKAEYARGYAKALEQLHKRVDEALKGIVSEAPRQGRRGPERLSRRFPLGQKGGGGGSPSAFRFLGLSARFEDGRWVFSGEVRPAAPLASWACEIRLAEVGEDGAEVSAIEIGALELGGVGARALAGGRATIQTAAPTMQFWGVSTNGTGMRALVLEVHGRSEIASGQ